MKILDAFTYTDIFETKGIEYLVIIGFLLLLIPTWYLLTRPVSMKMQLMRSINGLSAALLRIPRGLFYNRNHTWTYLEKSGAAKVGVDDLLLHITGGVSVDFLRTEGEKIRKGDLIATVSKDNRKLEITSPISGEIQKLNSAVAEKEGLINVDPYGKGWICKVKPENWKAEISECKMDDEAVEWSQSELLRCKDFMAEAVQLINKGTSTVILQEGGELTDFPLEDMPGEVWNKFQKEFLD
jgi:glycine cleavage system H protein